MPPPDRMRKERKQRPYWLPERGEICRVCGHPFTRETGHHCATCDGPLCVICATQEQTGAFICTVCHTSEGDE